MDDEVSRRSSRNPLQTTSVIVTPRARRDRAGRVQAICATDKLDIINGVVLDLPNYLLKKLEAQPDVFQHALQSADRSAQLPHRRHGRRARGAGARSATPAPASASRSSTPASPSWHDDLTKATRRSLSLRQPARHASSWTSSTAARCRTTTTVTARTSPASSLGNGYDSNGEQGRHRAGCVADFAQGARRAAAAARSATSSRRSTGWPPTPRPTTSASSTCRSAPASTNPYWTDPLTLAAKRVTDKGIIVVAAAGNLGKNAAGPAAVRRHHRAGQRAVGADRRRHRARWAR